MLDQLVLHRAVAAHLAGRRVAAVEAHKGVGQLIGKLPGDILVINVLRYAVIDVQQRHGIAGSAHTDVLAQCAVDIDLAGNGDAAADKAGVDIARFKPKLGREGGPALVGKGNIFFAALMRLHPVQQGQFKLRHTGKQVGVVAALAHFGGHIGADLGNAGVIGVFFVRNQQIQLGVFLDLNAQLIQALDGRIAGKEVLRAGTEGDDLQIAHAQNRAGNRHKFCHLIGNFLGSADGVLGDIGAQMPHPQVVRAVQHTAVGVAAPVDHIAVALGGSHIHTGTVKEFGKQRFGRFGTEVAQKYGQRIAARGGDLRHSLLHIGFVFHSGLRLVHGQALGGTGGGDGGAALFAQRNGKAVTADGDNAQLDLGNVGRVHR